METTHNKGKAVLPGGWSAFGPLDAQSMEVFETAMKGQKGVIYTPREVSTQVVAGTNYRFRCDAEVPGPSGSKYAAMIEIYQPLQGQPTITAIIAANGLLGGWTPFGPLTAESKEVFARATKGWDGVSYVPLEVSTQIVAGTNYRFICEGTTVTLEPSTFKASIEIHQPLDGPPVITRIDRI
jgi:hypothetical protein